MGRVAAVLSPNTLNIFQDQSLFPNVSAGPFISALTTAFIIAATLRFLAAACSVLRGKRTSCAENGGNRDGVAVEPVLK